MSISSHAADPIDKVVNAEMKRSKAPGIVVMVIRHGHVIKLKGYGEADLEHHVPVKPDTVFQSGSMGKQFTAALVMMLVQDRKLKLSDPIVKYIPEGKGKWGNVTIRHLLSHTSGIGDMPYETMDMTKEYSEDDLVKLMAKQPVRAKPGDKWQYNNGGYVLLGVLIHRATGKFYGDLLRERIFAPLGMKTAAIITEHHIVPNRARGYEFVNGEILNQEWVSPSLNKTADGSLYLSALDLQKWDQALDHCRLLSARTIARMRTPARLNDGARAIVNPGAKTPVYYGLGWTVCKRVGFTTIAHSGGWQGFRSHYARVEGLGLSVIVMANLDTADPATISKCIVEILEPQMRDGSKRADSRVP